MSEKELTEKELEKAAGGKRRAKVTNDDLQEASGGKRRAKISEDDLEGAAGGRRRKTVSEDPLDGNRDEPTQEEPTGDSGGSSGGDYTVLESFPEGPPMYGGH